MDRFQSTKPEILKFKIGKFRYLVYLNNRAAGKGSVKTIDLCDQKTAPLTPKSFIYNRRSYSQAGHAGSSPVSRSILSITYTQLASCRNPLFEVTGYADMQNPLKRLGSKG